MMNEIKMYMTTLKMVKANASLTTKELLPMVREALDLEACKENDLILAVVIENCKNTIKNFNKL